MEVGVELEQTQNVTLQSTQSINRLCWVSQSSPSTAGNSESNWVTKYLMEWVVPQGNWMERVRAEVIEGHIYLSMRRSRIGGIGIAGRLCSAMYPSSMKEQVEPELRKERKERSNCLQIRGWERESEVTTVMISSSTRTISFLLFIVQISWTTCHERMFIYFYYLPCITCMLHASNTCLSFLMLHIISSLLYHTHVVHALTMRYTHVLLFIYYS